MSDGFSFQQFTVRHDRCAMKVGTDGVLVGAWARGGRRVLDVGAGSAIVSLMMAQRFDGAWVDGIEIDPRAAAQARDNVAASPFAARVAIHAMPFQQFVPTARYDAIVSNPPYFLGAMKKTDSCRMLARHADTPFFADFFVFARQWLAPCGEVSLVVPPESLDDIATEAYLRGFLLSRRIGVHSVAGKPVERCLVSFVLRRLHEAEVGEAVLMDSHGQRTPWYDDLTRDFYLH